MNAFDEVHIAPLLILNLTGIYYVALRKTSAGVIVDALTLSITKAEAQMKADIVDVKIPGWAEKYPVTTIAAFRLADGILPKEHMNGEE